MTNRPCDWEGCSRTDHKARGLCKLHYERARVNTELRAFYKFSAPHTRRSSSTVCDCEHPFSLYSVWGTPVCSGCHRPEAAYIAERVKILNNKKGKP
jgi:hypothetical protein